MTMNYIKRQIPVMVSHDNLRDEGGADILQL